MQLKHWLVRWGLSVICVSTALCILVPVGGARAASTPWYERLSVRGYSQVRYNRLLETNPNLACDQCDKSWGNNGGFFLRRARLIFFGDVHERVYLYLQPDFASDGKNLGQLRDLYFDLALTTSKEYRLRFGQSKVPFGWENLQSSSNRLPLDRADPLNSAVPNERDLGVVFYWAPIEVRKRLRLLTSSGLKGSGDYGVFGLGLYNGQTPNKSEANNNLMVVSRLSYPFELPSGQFFEAGIQGYAQKYVLPSVTSGMSGAREQKDIRGALSAIWYPQPFGLQAEWNVGRGPEYSSEANAILTQSLSGGYVQAMYRSVINHQVLIPFTRYQMYDGGKKAELDARSYRVREWEIGAEWQPIPAFELVAHYTVSHRITRDGGNALNDQAGNLLRLQVQVNY